MENTINEILDSRYEELKQYIVQVEHKTVWDYKKQTNTTKVFLISENTQDVDPQESVTVEELKKLIVDNYIPIKTLRVFCEQTREQCIKYDVDQESKIVNLSIDG